MQAPIIALILATIANVLLGILVLARTRQHSYGWFFAITVISVAAWGIGDILILNARNTDAILLAERVFYAAPVLIPAGILLFSLHFLEHRKLTLANKVWLIGLPSIIFAFIAIFPHFVVDNVMLMEAGLNKPVINPTGFFIYAIYFNIYFLITYIVLFIKMKRFQGLERRQMLYTLNGVIFASLTALTTNLALPLLYGITDYIWLGPICTLVFIAAVTLSIVRHHLFDIRFYVLRSIAYSFSTIALGVLFISPMILLIDVVWLGYPFSWTRLVLEAIIATTVATNYGRLRNLLDRYSRHLFYQDGYDAAVLLGRLNRSLVSTINIAKTLQEVSLLINNSLKSEFCVFTLRVNQELRPVMTNANLDQINIKEVCSSLDNIRSKIIVTDELNRKHQAIKLTLIEHNIAVVVKLRPNKQANNTVGYMFLGYKKSGNPYVPQDIEVLDSTSDVLIIAIQNALHFEEIQNFNATLQQKVTAATKQLRHTNQRLKSLDETKDDFISMASHQLRTPLTSIKGYVSMVLEGDAGDITPLQKQMLNQAYISSQRMVFLIADLLNVSRLKTGKFVVMPGEMDLASVIDEEIEQLKETAESRQVSLRYDKPADFPAVILDETKIRQVVMNFMDNAIYYTRPGGAVHISLREVGSNLEFRIKDDGIGVPKDEQKHLFTKFYRAGNARQVRPDGTGLGLFMAKKVIVAQGGAIIFESQEGKGSTFGFSFARKAIVASQNTSIDDRIVTIT